jgi:hypothetical protein
VGSERERSGGEGCWRSVEVLARWSGGAVVWSGGSGTVGWRARGWCRRGCWNGEGGGAVAGGAGAGVTGRVAGWGESERERETENVKVKRERDKHESDREKERLKVKERKYNWFI